MATPPVELACAVFDESGGTVPVNIEDIARAHGVSVGFQEFEDSVSGILVVRSERSIIAVNQNHHRNRQRFTIAHELGHFLLHRANAEYFIDASPVFFRDDSSSGGVDPQEIEANQFAAELLMPWRVLIQRIGRNPVDALDESAVKRLASLFGVSAQALTIRLTRMGLVPDIPEYATK